MKCLLLGSACLTVVMPVLASAAVFNWDNVADAADNVLRFVGEKTHRKDNNKPVAYTLASPPFCNGLDCPEYKVLQNASTYELREYVATQWVSTSLKGIDFDTAQTTMFYRLFDYISGKNQAGQKIAMTAPVTTRIIPGQGPACENDFIMSFFVSPKEGNPPAPSDPTVELTSEPVTRVYVRSFGGFASKTKWLEEAQKLAEDLGSSVQYETTYYYTAGYDSPFKFLHRHNEIWFLAK